MRENEFEKKVQKEMEELQLRPSDSVWPNVEKELRQKKRRRIGFFFILLAGLGLLGYAGYTIYDAPASTVAEHKDDHPSGNSSQKRQSADQQVNIPGGNAQPSRHAPVFSPRENKPAPINPSTAGIPEKRSAPAVLANRATTGNVTGEPLVKNRKTKERKINEVYNYTKPGAGKKNNEDATAILLPTTPVDKKDTIEKAVAVNTVPENTLPVIPAADSTASNNSVAATSDTNIAVVPAPLAAKKKKNLSRIKWGADLSAGKNSSVDNVFSVLNTSKSLRDYSASNLPSGSTNAQRVRPPSAIKGGVAFKAGLVAEYRLTKKSSLVSGLRYAYLSEHMKTGRFRDTVIFSTYLNTTTQSGIYNASPEKTYTNRYHIIELPVLYQLQLTNKNKPALLWNAGFSINYLVTTNALAYDTAAGGIYYWNKNAFNRLFINLRTGFLLQIGDRSKIQWSAGPEFSVNANPLMKQNAFVRKRYLTYAGVTARFILPAKKK